MSTGKIRQLPASVAEKIAAGEVIERPYSVVKELVENALDAQATEISIRLEDGGKGLIEVVDNGAGMSDSDLALCVRRHATSKLSAFEDLNHLSTLGFRGEALPSIAAVSELRILSRAPGLESAHEVLGPSFEPNRVTFGQFIDSQTGTRIQARGLFSQVPARLKFLRSQNAEVGQVREWVERLAIAYSSVGFSLVSDDRSLLLLRPQSEEARIRSLLAEEKDYPLLQRTTDQSYQGFKLRVYWFQGLSTPQTRKIVQVVNARPVRDKVLQQAILAPFRQTLLPGQFPAIAVFLDVDPGAIDVNVHPTKTELRFLEPRKVTEAIYSLLSSMIGENGSFAYASSALNSQSWEKPGRFKVSEPELQESWTFLKNSLPAEVEHSHPFMGKPRLGIAFNTYLIYDLGEELALIDQHAAHERIRYEKLSRKIDGTRQALLVPEAIRFDPAERSILERKLEPLASKGFEAEIFGEDTVLFRSVPAEWGTEMLRARLGNLVARLASESLSADLDETLFEALASEACHSAVRAGDRLEEIEAEALVSQLFECEHPWNCPHGRPTIARIPRAKFEEWFQRRL